MDLASSSASSSRSNSGGSHSSIDRGGETGGGTLSGNPVATAATPAHPITLLSSSSSSSSETSPLTSPELPAAAAAAAAVLAAVAAASKREEMSTPPRSSKRIRQLHDVDDDGDDDGSGSANNTATLTAIVSGNHDTDMADVPAVHSLESNDNSGAVAGSVNSAAAVEFGNIPDAVTASSVSGPNDDLTTPTPRRGSRRSAAAAAASAIALYGRRSHSSGSSSRGEDDDDDSPPPRAPQSDGRRRPVQRRRTNPPAESRGSAKARNVNVTLVEASDDFSQSSVLDDSLPASTVENSASREASAMETDPIALHPSSTRPDGDPLSLNNSAGDGDHPASGDYREDNDAGIETSQSAVLHPELPVNSSSPSKKVQIPFAALAAAQSTEQSDSGIGRASLRRTRLPQPTQVKDEQQPPKQHSLQRQPQRSATARLPPAAAIAAPDTGRARGPPLLATRRASENFAAPRGRPAGSRGRVGRPPKRGASVVRAGPVVSHRASSRIASAKQPTSPDSSLAISPGPSSADSSPMQSAPPSSEPPTSTVRRSSQASSARSSEPPPNPPLTPSTPPVFSRFNGLTGFLSSFVWIEDELISANDDELERRAEDEAVLSQRIQEFQRRGLLGDRSKSSSTTLAQQTAPTLPGASSSTSFGLEPLDEAATHWSRLHEEIRLASNSASQHRRMKLSNGKKISKAVQRYWELKKTEGERLARLEEKRLRKLAKAVSAEVAKKWKVVDAIVKGKQKELYRREQERAGKRQLQAILNQSTHILTTVASSSQLISQSASPTQVNSEDPALSDFDSIDARDAEDGGDFDESDYMDDDIDDDEDAESDDEDSSDDTPLHQLLGYTDEGIPADTTQEHPPSPLYQDERQGENMNDSSSESEDESDDDDDVIEVLPNRPSAFPSKPKEQESATPPNGRPKSKDDVPKVGATPVEAKKVSNPDVPEVPAIVNGVDAQTAIGDAAATEKKPLEASLEHSSTAMNHNHIEDEMMHDPAEKAEQAILPSTPTIPKVRASDSVDPSVSEDMDQYEPASQDSDSSPRARDLIEAPTGNTLTTTNVRVKVPFLLRHSLREYQHVGLDWLAKLYNNGLNGILADEMGLGKTIQTIALIAYLAVEKGIWGPHLIVVPTSVMLNWEFEFKKWCPGLKILTYYGSQTQRREKRTGWSKPNAFHVCITSYQLVLTDQVMLKRRPWHYLILDEAHNIKNFRSQRWQVLLNFSSQRRLLLTGTPLQNNLMELWSLMYFLMPNGVSSAMPTGFATLKDFQEWFARPVEHLVEGAGGDAGNEVRETVAKLHTVLRPYLLRRLKRDVEKQMPGKFEHVVYCKLSLRQRFLYDDYMSRAKTKEDLASGNYMSIINCLMQLRKVCNHPDLFEVRPIVTSFAMYGSAVDQFEPAYSMLDRLLQFKQDHTSNPWPPFAGSLDLDLSSWNLLVTDPRVERYSMMATLLINRLDPDQHFDETVVGIAQSEMALRAHFAQMMGGTNNGPPLSANYSNINEHANLLRLRQASQTTIRWFRMRVANRIRCQIHPLYGAGIIYVIKTLGRRPIDSFHPTLPSYTDAFEPIRKARSRRHWNARLSQEIIADLVPTLSIRLAGDLGNLIDRFAFVTPRARVVQRWGGAPIGPPAGLWSKRAPVEEARLALEKLLGVTPGPPSRRRAQPVAEKFTDVLHAPHNRLTIAFPDRWLLQYDCGKLQVLAVILRRLKQGGHRALIFTQMTRVLDVLEQFLNLHGYIYLRLDGATKIEERKILMDRFNNDSRNFVFILSTRSGGVGMNLTGADTVIFYDSDWNPAMDAQAQDRAHRIGQTRDVHIYRLISKHTIEENMLRKADEKRRLDSVVIQEGEFTVDHLKKMDWRDWLDDDMTRMLPMSSSSAAFPVRDTISMEDLPAPVAANPISRSVASWEEAMMAVEDEPDVRAMQSARTEMAAELHEFDETGSTSLGPPVTATPSALVNPSQNIASADMPPPPPPPVTVAGGESAVVDVAGRDASNNDVPTTRTTAIGPSAGTGREADDGEVGHVDDYMIRFWVWNLGLPASFVELLHEPT